MPAPVPARVVPVPAREEAAEFVFLTQPMMIRNPIHADKRYSHQTQWSRPLREYIYGKFSKGVPLSILEVGCGTGSVIRRMTEELSERTARITGIDIDYEAIRYASRKSTESFCTGAGEALPFPANMFDLVFCHYLLLWVPDPVKILKEMKRVTVSGGICAAMAEPCYAEMTATPESIRDLAVLQRKKLISRGIDPETGSRLAEYFRKAGLSSIDFGQYKKTAMTDDYLRSEIRQMAEDAGQDVFSPEPGPDFEYFVPTYFAVAVK